jgi:hypothetical protein
MNSSANQISPIGHRRDAPSRVADFSNRQVFPDVLEFVVDLPPPGRNMPSTPLLTQGGMLGRSGAGIGSVSAFSRIAPAIREERSADPAGIFQKAVETIRKAVINAVWMQFQAFIKNLPRQSMIGCLCRNRFCNSGI